MAGRPRSRFTCDREFLRRIIDVHSDTRAQFCRRVGIDNKSLTDALSDNNPTLSHLCAAKMGAHLSIPYLDFFPVDATLQERLRDHQFTVPREHATQPQGKAWAPFAIEDALREALEGGYPVVLFGPDGSGKASLAASFAQRLMDTFPRGILWVDQRTNAHWAEAQSCVASALRFVHHGAEEEQAEPAMGHGSVNDFARLFWSRRRLLVVDNLQEPDFVVDLCGLRNIRSGTGAPQTPLLVLTDRDSAATELCLHHRFLRFDVPPIADGAVQRQLEHTLNSQLEASSDGHPSPVDSDAFDSLVRAIRGRPAALALASDLLNRDFGALEDIDRVLRLRDISHAGRRLLLTLRVLAGAQFPRPWARALLPDMDEKTFSEAFDSLCESQLVKVLGSERFVLHPHLQGQLPDALMSQANTYWQDGKRQLLRRIHSESSSRAPGLGATTHYLQRWPQLWKLCFGMLFDAVAPEQKPAEGGGGLDVMRNALVDTMLAWAPGLSLWSERAVERWLYGAIRIAEQNGRKLAHAELQAALARWTIIERSDFAEVMVLLEHSCRLAEDVEQDLGSTPQEVARAQRLNGDCRVELGRACFVVGRARESEALFHEALELARRSDVGACVIAQRLNCAAVAETRRPRSDESDPPSGQERWARAEILFEEGIEILSADGTACEQCFKNILAHNRALTRFVLKDGAHGDELATSIRALTSPTLDKLTDVHLLSTAMEAGIDVTGEGLAYQAERCAAIWRNAFNCPDSEVRDVGYHLGQTVFYLTVRHAPDSAGPLPVAEGIAVSDHSIGGNGVCESTDSCFILHAPGPLAGVFDGELIEAAERFLETRGPVDHRATEWLNRYKQGRLGNIPGISP